jgi:hypothetical protein
MNFSSLSNLRGSQWGSILLALIMQKSPFMRYMEDNSAFELVGTEGDYRPANAESDIQSRDEGGGYTPQAITLDSKINTLLYFHGGAVSLDETRLADAEKNLYDINTYLNERYPEEFKKFIIGYELKLFQGSGAGTPKLLKGLKTILDGSTDIPGFTDIKGVINANDYCDGDSFDLTVRDNDDAFIEGLRLWLSEVENPNGIIVNPRLGARLATIADKWGAAGLSVDKFGQSVKTFDNIPIITTLATSILNTENDDNAVPVAETTSLYIAAAGEGAYSILTNSGLSFKDFDIEPNNVKSTASSWEIRSANRIKMRNCVRRVRYIKC